MIVIPAGSMTSRSIAKTGLRAPAADLFRRLPVRVFRRVPIEIDVVHLFQGPVGTIKALNTCQ